jgi:hypothetical protein
VASAGEEALHFAERTVRLNPTSEDMVVIATYAFTNATQRTVTITRVVPTCGCMTAQLSASILAPGSSGTLKVGMELGNLAGIQIKQIMLETDHPDEPRLPLMMEVTLPPTPIITGGDLAWMIGQPAPERSFSVILPARFPFTVEKVTCSDARVGVETIQSHARRFEVMVKLRDATQPFTALVQVHMQGSAKRFHVKVKVGEAPSTHPRPASATGVGAPAAAP